MPPDMNGYSFSTDIRVRFAETDAQGIVHNANYAVWFEVARVGYLERYAGGYQRLRDVGVEALVLETHVRYLRPAVFDDRLLVHARCLDLSGARFRYEYAVERVGRGDRRRLDGPRDGRRRHSAADAGPRVARRGNRHCRGFEPNAGGMSAGFFFGPTRTSSGTAR